MTSQLHKRYYGGESAASSTPEINTRAVQSNATNDYTTQNGKNDENISDQSAALTQTSILRHVYECKVDNKFRLKQVRNLEELVKFRIKTVGDNMMEEGHIVNAVSQKKGLFHLRKVVDPLLTSAAYPAIRSKKDPTTGAPSAMQIQRRIDELNGDSIIAEKSDFLLEPSSQEMVIEDDHKEVPEKTKTEKEELPLTEEQRNEKTRKTANQQINDILKLDDKDPIRKLQHYFKDSHFGHEYTEDGVRIPKRYKAPKHKNFVMQRYEQQRQREIEKLNKRTLSQQPSKVLNHGSGSQALSDDLSLNKSIDGDDDYRQGGAVGSKGARIKSEQKLMKTNFLSQLKQLQELLKESMLDAMNQKSDDELQGFASEPATNETQLGVQDPNQISGGVETLMGNSQENVGEPLSVSLPKLVKGVSENSRQQDEPIAMIRRGSTQQKLDMLDQISAYKDDTQELVQKYWPTNMRKLNESIARNGEQFLERVDSRNMNVAVIGEEGSSETSESESMKPMIEVKDSPFQGQKKEKIDKVLLMGVDSDEEIMDQLVKQAQEIKNLQKEINDKRNENEEVEKFMQFQKLRKQMADNLRKLADPTQIDDSQRALIAKVTGKSISTLSQISAVRQKDYITYNDEQLRVFQLLNSQNESQKRINRVQERRKNYENSIERAYVSQKVLDSRHEFTRSAERQTVYGGAPSMVRLRQPFTKKKFVEDIQKSAYDFRKDKAADRLPKIQYGSMKQMTHAQSTSSSPRARSMQVVRKLELQSLYSKELALQNQSSSQSILLHDNSNRSVSYRKNMEKLYYASAASKADVDTSYLAHQNNQMSLNARRIPLVAREIQEITHDNQSMTVESEMMRVSGVSPFKQTQKDSSSTTQIDARSQSFMNGMRSSFSKQKPPGTEYAMQESSILNRDLLTRVNPKQSIQITSDKTKRIMTAEEVQNELKEVRSEKIIESPPQQKLHNIKVSQDSSSQVKTSSAKRFDNMQVGSNTLEHTRENEIFIRDQSMKSRQKINLNNKGGDDVKQSTLQSINPSEDVYNDEIMVTHSRLNRNQSSLGHDKSQQQLQSQEEMVRLQASSSDLRGEQPMPLSRKQSFIYHDSIGTMARDHNESSRFAVMPEEIAIHDPDSPNIGSIVSKSIEKDSKEKTVVQSKEFKVTNSSQLTKFEESTESLNILVKYAQQEVSLTLEKVDEGELTKESNKKSAQLFEAEIPKIVQIRHQAVAMESSTEDLAFDNPARQLAAIGKKMKKDTSHQTRIVYVPSKGSLEPIESGFRSPRMQVHIGAGISRSGYESENPTMDPKSYNFINDVAHSVSRKAKAKGWHAKRFKRFPRFSIYLTRDKTNNHLERNYISLNNRMLSYLAEQEPEYARREEPKVHEVSTDSIMSNHAILMIQEVGQSQEDNMLQQSTQNEDQSVVDQSMQNNAMAQKEATRYVGEESELRSPLASGSILKVTPGRIDEFPQTQDSVQSMGSIDIKMATPVKLSKDQQLRQNDSQLPYLKSSSRQSPPALQSSGPSRGEQVVPQTHVIDPFDRVLLLKNIDNAILTSFRTLNKQNNQISHTMKVIHNKFTPNQLSKHVKNTFKKAAQALYCVSEVESANDGFSDEEKVQERQQKVVLQTEVLVPETSLGNKPNTTMNPKLNLLQAQNNVDESLLSSMEMSPTVGKMNTTSSRGLKKDHEGKPPSFFTSKEGLGLNHGIKSSIATIEGVNEEQEGSKVRMTSRDAGQMSPGTQGTLANNEATSGQAVFTRSGVSGVQNEISFLKHHQEVIKAQKVMKNGEQTFTEKPRQTAGFGSRLADNDIRSSGRVMREEDPKLSSAAATPKPQSANDHDLQTVLNSKFQQADEVGTRKDGSSEVDSKGVKALIDQSSDQNYGNVSKRQTVTSQRAQEFQKSDETIDTTNVLLQVLKPVTGAVEAKAVDNTQGKVPAFTTAAAAAKAQQNQQNSQNSWHRNNTKAHTSGSNGQKIKIREANVDDYLGDYAQNNQQLQISSQHSSFKTSKIILQVKNQHLKNKNQKDLATQDKQKSVVAQPNQPRELNSRIFRGSTSTFVFQDSMYPKLMAGRNSNASVNESQTSLDRKKTNQFLALDQDGQKSSEGTVEQRTHYSQHLNAIIEQTQSFHVKKTSVPDLSKLKPTKGKKTRSSSFGKEDNVLITVPQDKNITSQLAASLGINFTSGMAQSYPVGEMQQKLETQGIEDSPINSKKQTANAYFSGQLNPFKSQDPVQRSFDHREEKAPKTVLETNTQRIYNNELSTKRVETANLQSSKTDLAMSQQQELMKKQLEQGAATPKLQQSFSNLDHMLVRASPSHASNIESTMHLAGKMQHSTTTQGRQQPNAGTISPDLQMTANRNSVILSATQEGSPRLRASQQMQQSMEQTRQQLENNLEIKENKSHSQFRQTALIKQSGMEQLKQGSYVKVPQTHLMQQQSQSGIVQGASRVKRDSSDFTLKQPQSSTKSRERERLTISIERGSQCTPKTNLGSAGRQRDHSENTVVRESEQHEIAQRIVMPKAAHRVRQMIDSLCQKEKNVVYQNPNVREDCIGTMNTIFDLSSSHLVNRPALLQGQAKQAKKNITQLEQEAEFSGNSFLAGQSALIQPKPRFERPKYDARKLVRSPNRDLKKV